MGRKLGKRAKLGTPLGPTPFRVIEVEGAVYERRTGGGGGGVGGVGVGGEERKTDRERERAAPLRSSVSQGRPLVNSTTDFAFRSFLFCFVWQTMATRCEHWSVDTNDLLIVAWREREREILSKRKSRFDEFEIIFFFFNSHRRDLITLACPSCRGPNLNLHWICK